MNDEPSVWGQVAREMGTAAVLIAAIWGALGGATNALSTRMTWRDALRHVVIGALLAAGGGAAGVLWVADMLDLPMDTVAALSAGGAFGSGCYLVGIFGPALLELVLTRVRGGRLPRDPGGQTDA